jgi:tetratricopeptide (TPR) repeat protein
MKQSIGRIAMNRITLTAALLIAALQVPGVHADGGEPAKGAALDPAYDAAVAAIRANDFPRAVDLFRQYTLGKSDNANAWNWLGYAQRKTGNLTAAFAAYDKALAIDPAHRGAREYLGEAFLLDGKPEKAEEQLRELDKLCWLPCEEYKDLKAAIAAYKKAR